MLVQLKEESNLKVVFDIPETQSAGYSKMGRVKLNTEKLEKLGWTAEVYLKEGIRKNVRKFLGGFIMVIKTKSKMRFKKSG